MLAVYRLFGNERGAPARVSSLVAVRLAKCELRDDVTGSPNKRGRGQPPHASAHEKPVMAFGSARGSRGPHTPAATRLRKSAMRVLTRSGSSMFSV